MSYLVLDLETITDERLTLPKDKRFCEKCKGVRSEFFCADTIGLSAEICGHIHDPPFLPPTYHQIVAIGFALVTPELEVETLDVLLADSPTKEAAILAELFEFLELHNPVLVGWNTRGFDAPVLAARALSAGVPFPWYYRHQGTKGPRYRYTHTHHYDVKDYLGDYGAARTAGLDAVAQSIGLPGKVGVDGSQVGDLFRAGKLEEIGDYCCSDVAQETGVMLRTELLRGRIERTTYAKKAAALLRLIDEHPRLEALRGKTDARRFTTVDADALRFLEGT